MLTFDDEEFASRMESETGSRPEWRGLAFSDLDESVRASIRKIKESPFIPRADKVRGFIYDVKSGSLREVS
jgi:carbonic anhydrase